MKKIILGISISTILLLIVILIFSFQRKQQEKVEVYTIPREYAYWYQPERKMDFMIYANQKNSYIEYGGKNHYELCNEQLSYTLMNVEIRKEWNCEEEDKTFYCYHIEADMMIPSTVPLEMKNVRLLIENDQFNWDCPLGNLTIYPSNWELLSVTDLYGNYSYVENELQLIGITIGLEQTGYLKRASIGFVDANLNYVEKDVLYDSERSIETISHPIISSKREYTPVSLDAVDHYYFIPISYEELHLITTAAMQIQIEDVCYVLDSFCYFASPIQLSCYPSTRRRCSIDAAST